VLRCVGIMAQPFVPSSAAKLLELLAVEPEDKQALPELRLRMEASLFEADVGGSTLSVPRAPDAAAVGDENGDDDGQDALTLPG